MKKYMTMLTRTDQCLSDKRDGDSPKQEPMHYQRGYMGCLFLGISTLYNIEIINNSIKFQTWGVTHICHAGLTQIQF